MKPWREEMPEDLSDDLELEASRLLAQSADVPTWLAAEKRAVWERLDSRPRADATNLLGVLGWGFERAFGPTAGLRLPLALAGSMTLLVFALVHTRTSSTSLARKSALPASAMAAPEWTSVDLGAVGKLRVQARTTYRLPATAHPGEYRIALDDGALCAEIAHRDLPAEGPLLVETPQMQVVVVGTRFCVETRRGISTVAVSEGRVRVHTASGSAFVGAGETLVSSAGTEAGAPSTAAGATGTGAGAPSTAAGAKSAETSVTTSPVARPLPGQLANQLIAAREQPPAAPAPQAAIPPSSLAEQNALYALGTHARDRHDGPAALSAWRSYLSRFPTGVLAPEASAGVLGELVTEGRDSEALIAADDYLGSFPADGRAAEVAFIRGNLLHDRQGRIADALSAYRQALALATRPGLRDDALFAVGVCERMIGHTAEAQETFRRYQTEFPNGAHAGELSRWLSQ